MKPMGIVGALVGGVVGALAWALIASKAGVEVGYVAWGIGLAVGALSYALGGRNLPNGIMCAAVSLAAIFIGKVMAVKWSAPPELADIATWSNSMTLAKESLDAMDLLFAGLGVVTAFQLGGRAESEVPSYSPEQMAYQPPASAPAGGTETPPAQPYQPYGSVPDELPAEDEEPPSQQKPQ